MWSAWCWWVPWQKSSVSKETSTWNTGVQEEYFWISNPDRPSTQVLHRHSSLYGLLHHKWYWPFRKRASPTEDHFLASCLRSVSATKPSPRLWIPTIKHVTHHVGHFTLVSSCQGVEEQLVEIDIQVVLHQVSFRANYRIAHMSVQSMSAARRQSRTKLRTTPLQETRLEKNIQTHLMSKG